MPKLSAEAQKEFDIIIKLYPFWNENSIFV